MSEVLTNFSLIDGAVGGAIALIGKHLLDRFTESHRAKVALLTRRQERFFDKQLGVVADQHKRLAQLVNTVRAIRLSDWDIEDGLSKEDVATLQEEIDKAMLLIKSSMDEGSINDLYLPENMISELLMFHVNLHFKLSGLEKILDGPIDGRCKALLQEVDDHQLTADTLLKKLKATHLELITGGQSHDGKISNMFRAIRDWSKRRVAGVKRRPILTRLRPQGSQT